MSAISDKVNLRANRVRVLPYAHYLTLDQRVCVEYKQHLGLERAQYLIVGGSFFIPKVSISLLLSVVFFMCSLVLYFFVQG